MPDLMMIDVPDISAARAERVWTDVLATATREQSRSSRRRTIGISAAATSLAGALGVALLAPTSSFASWTEVPTPIQVSLEDPVLASCLTALPDVPRSRVGLPASRSFLGELRGDFTAMLLSAEGSLSICIADDVAFASASVPAPPLRPGQVLSLLANAGSVDAEGARYVYGRVARSVQGVTVVLDDGVRVTASVGNGYFVAWWPAPGAPVTVTAIDESGHVLAALIPSEG